MMKLFCKNKTLLQGAFVLCLGALVLLSACKEEIDTSSRYVFRERTIASYLEDHQQFSEYIRLLKEQPVSEVTKTTVYQLLTAYGHYTCFAPTNKAIQCYLDSLAESGFLSSPTWDGFPNERLRDSIRSVIVMNSLLDGTRTERIFMTSQFPEKNEEFSLSTMADRKISVVRPKVGSDELYIDGHCLVSPTNRDIETINGVIHEIAGVISPSNETLGSTMHNFASDYTSGYSVMGRLLERCNLTDTLSQIKDYRYEELVRTGKINEKFNGTSSHFSNVPRPTTRKYGFTLFAETDEFWATTLGKAVSDITVEDVKDWVIQQNFYPEALDNDDYSDENNVLNQFVTYHLLPMRLPVDKLVIHSKEKGYNKRSNTGPTIPVWEHHVTMGKRRLLRIWESFESQGKYLNRFPELDNSRHGTYHETSCSPENQGIFIDTQGDKNIVKLVNAFIYPIDQVLVYDQHVRRELSRQRLRYDILDFTEEMQNNDMRDMGYGASFSFTNDEEYKYFNNIWINSRETYFYVLNGYGQTWPNYQEDEVCTEGLYDCTWLLPPVPMSGTYEIRMGVSTFSSWRGICQIYFGTKRDNLTPTGIPVDMALGGMYRRVDGYTEASIVGWVDDTQDDDANAELDKKMRNNGFMKGPEYIVGDISNQKTNRRNENSTRRIIVRQHMDANQRYYMRFKTVQDSYSKQLFLDYIEWCPKEVYDNPETPEDIW